MKLRWKLLIAVVAIFIVPLLLILAMHFKLKHDVASYKKQMLAQGEKLAISDWIPQHSTDENAGRNLVDILRPFSGINRDRHPSLMRMVAPGRAQVSWQSVEIYDWEFKKRTNIWRLIRNDFEANAEALEELRKATDGGEIIFPVAYEQGFHALLPHLVSMKNGAVWLSGAAIFSLHEGDRVGAVNNLKASLDFWKNYKGEPLLISHMVRVACLQISFNATWEALQHPELSDKELHVLQQAWAAIPTGDSEAVFSMERAMGIQMFAEARVTGEDPQELIMGSSTTILDDLNEFKANVLDNPKAAFEALFNQPNRKLWKWIKSYQDELDMLKMWQAGIEAARIIENLQTFQPAIRQLEEALDKQSSDNEDFLFGDSKSILLGTLPKFASAKIIQNLAITGCALERYKRENHEYPNELRQLAPKYLTKIPSDPIDGQPLRYRANSDGTFLLYSIGQNGTDEGGNGDRNLKVNPSLIDSDLRSTTNKTWTRPVYPTRALDWIWPNKATEEQILEWERHESDGAE